MRLIIFALAFMLLIATTTLAAGLEITEIQARADYDYSYVYELEQEQSITTKNYASVSVANGSKVDLDVFPDSNLTLSVRVENTFQGDQPIIRNVIVTATIEGINGGEDFEKKSIDFDLEPGEDYRADIKFNIPVDIQSGTHNLKLEIEGEGRNGTPYRTDLGLKLDIKKVSHDIKITKVLLNPSIVDCDRKAKLTATIVNAGSNEENEIALEFKSATLGINSYDKDIHLASSDDASISEKSYAKNLNLEAPSFFRSGNYPILINLYWKNFVLFDTQTADLTIRDCKAAAKSEQKNIENQTSVETQIENGTAESGQKKDSVVSTEELPVSNFQMFVFIIVGSFVVVMIAILVTFGYIKRHRHKV